MGFAIYTLFYNTKKSNASLFIVLNFTKIKSPSVKKGLTLSFLGKEQDTLFTWIEMDWYKKFSSSKLP
jgi:hypothetical protein